MLKTICNTLVLPTADEACAEAAERFVGQAVSSVAENDFFAVALPGGVTPADMLEKLASPEYASLVPWSKTHIFQTDERHVPHDHKDSNYRILNQILLANVPIPSANVHAFAVHLHHTKAASEYQNELIAVLGEPPCLNLAILGVGTDGHTASLFPGSDVLEDKTKYAAACWVESLAALRLTLTLPTLRLARKTIFLVTGAHKASAVAKCVGTGDPEIILPARLVTQSSRDTLWILDESAASELVRC
jgi:6-phosphogluconolactonase